ncbi:osmotically-inducible lipoprotein OsmE [Pseudomonas sp. LS1212]|uniref:osmotically-inducible lipoprotein OsmE n=1 Tax=Pseudomonas sp. LS1212 TaxID=2972478 RepID=UPI00215C9741|nr:osmotically-inducible lipoprotein OsmE [Pseudomonas sp. LS1212]UVJ45896.1 osmotically-inducible lipoprotein OsmE [Pseudomonas sp. LS1212]
MNKHLLATCVVLAALGGCANATYEAYRDQPLVAQVKKGMSKQQVLRIGGQPLAEVARTQAPGSCFDYRLSQASQQQPYHVSFDVADSVDHQGFKTCDQWSEQQRKAKQSEGVGGMGGVGGSGY